MKNSEPTTSRIGARLYALAAAVVLLTAACGTGAGDEEAAPEVAALSDDSGDGQSDDADPNGDSQDGEDGEPTLSPEEAQLAFSQCLEEKGIDDPFAGGDGETIEGDEGTGAQSAQIVVESEEDAAAFEAAFEECGEIFEDNFGEFELTPEQEAEMADLEAAFNQCMTDAGYEVTGDNTYQVEGDPEDFEAAAAECDEIFEEGLSIDGAEGEG